MDAEYRPISPLRTALFFVASLAFGFSAMIGAVLLLISPMMFDAPGSNTAVAPLLFLALAAYPVSVVVGLIRLWRAHGRGDSEAAFHALGIPLAGLLLIVGLISLI